MNEYLLGAIIAMAMILVEVIKILLEKVKLRNGKNGYQTKLLNLTQKIYDMHDVKDEDGLPVWYYPRRLLKTFDTLLEMQRDMIVLMREMNAKLDKKK